MYEAVLSNALRFVSVVEIWTLLLTLYTTGGRFAPEFGELGGPLNEFFTSGFSGKRLGTRLSLTDLKPFFPSFNWFAVTSEVMR